MSVVAEPVNNYVYAVAASDFGQPYYEVHRVIRPREGFVVTLVSEHFWVLAADNLDRRELLFRCRAHLRPPQ